MIASINTNGMDLSYLKQLVHAFAAGNITHEELWDLIDEKLGNSKQPKNQQSLQSRNGNGKAQNDTK